MKSATTPMPTIYLPHGGGPWPWMRQYDDEYRNLRSYFNSLLETLPTRPSAVLRRFDPEQHIRLGAAIAPLRERGVLILGSGMSYHNMSAFFEYMGGGSPPMGDSIEFDEWLWKSAQLEEANRRDAFIQWAQAPKARACHPREEHLMPLHIVVGAAGNGSATLDFRGPILGAQVSALRFG